VAQSETRSSGEIESRSGERTSEEDAWLKAKLEAQDQDEEERDDKHGCIQFEVKCHIYMLTLPCGESSDTHATVSSYSGNGRAHLESRRVFQNECTRLRPQPSTQYSESIRETPHVTGCPKLAQSTQLEAAFNLSLRWPVVLECILVDTTYVPRPYLIDERSTREEFEMLDCLHSFDRATRMNHSWASALIPLLHLKAYKSLVCPLESADTIRFVVAQRVWNMGSEGPTP